MQQQIIIDQQFNGPPHSGNGGYVAGAFATAVGGPCEVTLIKPPPLDTPLDIRPEADATYGLYAGDDIVAKARETQPRDNKLPFVAYEAAIEAGRRGLKTREATDVFTSCFVCGPDREPDDGLRLFAGDVSAPSGSESAGHAAVDWQPSAAFSHDGTHIAPEFVWSALDCPSAAAIGIATGEAQSILLGRLDVGISRVPAVDERCVIVSKMSGQERRKIFSDVSLFSQRGEVLASGLATWIEVSFD